MVEGQLVNTHQEFCTQVRVTSTTTRALFGLDWEDIAHLADNHTQAVQRWLSSRSPHGKRFQGIGFTATSTGIQAALLNLALGGRFPPTAEDKVIDCEIDAVISFFAEQNAPFMWWLSPFVTPSDIKQRLAQRRFKPREYHLPTMVAPLTASDKWPEFDPRIKVWRARGRADLQAASTIRRTAFRFAEGVALTYFEDMADGWLRGDPARLFLAGVGEDGPPVAMGALIMGAKRPGVYVMATMPEWERRGLGKAVLTRILGDAAAEGHELIVLTAGARAYSLYRKFGFQHIFEYVLYHRQS